MTEKEFKELEKFAKENGHNDEIKDIYTQGKLLTEIKNTNEIKFSTKHSTSYKHTLSYWYFCNCFKDYSNSRDISGKKFMYKIFKTSNRSRQTYQKTKNS